jgi:hypothetical protein
VIARGIGDSARFEKMSSSFGLHACSKIVSHGRL